MTKESLILFAGLLLMVIPFLGIPDRFKTYLIMGIGFLLLIVGYILRRNVFLERISQVTGERATDSFVETTDTLFHKDTVQ